MLAERRKVAVAQADAAIAQAQLADGQAIIEDLKLRIAKARQAQWGQSSERQKHLIDQMELQLEDLVASATEDEVAAETAVSKAAILGVPFERFTRKKPARAPLPDHLPRRRVVVPAPQACTCCQGTRLGKIGESVTETREVVPRQWIVVQTVREKFVCKDCETISQPPAPFHPISRASAGPNLLAMVLFNKFSLHQPLNRQSETYAAEGINLSVSTLADYVGRTVSLLRPVIALVEGQTLGGERVHHDDTHLPVLAAGKTIRRQSIASISSANCAGVSTTPPLMSGGQTTAAFQTLGEQAKSAPVPVHRLQIVAALASEVEMAADWIEQRMAPADR